MNIYEAIGIGFVIYMTCCGVYAHIRLVIEGIKRTKGHIDLGSTTEDAAVHDFLVINREVR
jgi:hypothetical protein